MIFVFGGAYAGKEDYVKNNLGEDKKIIRDIHIYVKRALQNGKNPHEEVERLMDENPEAVFISNEVGCGIVPEDRFEREWREAVGRVNSCLAKRADSVIRVVCGIGTVIK